MGRDFEGFKKMMDERFAELEQWEKKLEDTYNSGVEAGVKQMMDKIQRHCELGKPVLANGELYFFKTARQNLIDIMDDIDEEYGIEKENKYIVPISITHSNGKVEREVVIKTNKPES